MKVYIIFGYNDPENAHVIGKDDSLLEAIKTVLIERNPGCAIYEYEDDGGDVLKNEHGPLWDKELERRAKQSLKADGLLGKK